MVAGPCIKARAAQNCQEEKQIAVVRPIVPKGLKKNQNAPRPSEHPPVRGKNVKTFRWDHRLQIRRLQIQNLFMVFQNNVIAPQLPPISDPTKVSSQKGIGLCSLGARRKTAVFRSAEKKKKRRLATRPGRFFF